MNKVQESFLLGIGIAICCLIYWPGLHGGFLFDDYPNIVNNQSLHIETVSISHWTDAAQASPSDLLVRPLSMLSFAVNYSLSGLNPFWMKLTNLALHVLSGVLLFCTLTLFFQTWKKLKPEAAVPRNYLLYSSVISTIWLLAPINLSTVLYVVQRMEILAQIFVLLGLIAYLYGRLKISYGQIHFGYFLMSSGLIAGTILGVLAKETAILLPAYILAIEIFVFTFRDDKGKFQTLLAVTLYAIVTIPAALGLLWLLPGIISGASFSTRDFTVYERLLTETRVIWHYLYWIVFPSPETLGFYHDDIGLSRSWLQPPTTLLSALTLLALGCSTFLLRKLSPLYSLGVVLFFISHALTSTILPLELVFEHRNYFASIGIFLSLSALIFTAARRGINPVILMSALLAYSGWNCTITLIRSMEWSDPVSFAYSEAVRNPKSPRAQYEFGRTLVIASDYDPESPLLIKAEEVLQNAMSLPESSILPEIALITVSGRTGRKPDSLWWKNIVGKLEERPPRAEEVTGIRSILSCQFRNICPAWTQETVSLVLSALAHKKVDVYLLADYAQYAAYVLNDKKLALRVAEDAVKRSGNNEKIASALAPILRSPR